MAVDGRNVDADLLEEPPAAQDRHHATALVSAIFRIRAIAGAPRLLALEAPSRQDGVGAGLLPVL